MSEICGTQTPRSESGILSVVGKVAVGGVSEPGPDLEPIFAKSATLLTSAWDNRQASRIDLVVANDGMTGISLSDSALLDVR